MDDRWIFVSDTGFVTDVSNDQLKSCGDITGETRCPSQIGELEQIEDPINASKLLKWIEQSCEVAELIRVNEDLVCRISPTEGRHREGQILRLHINVSGNRVRGLRGKQRTPVEGSHVRTHVFEAWSWFCVFLNSMLSLSLS